MLTVPATNIATLMVIKNELGKHELGLYLLAIISSALVSGLMLDFLFEKFDWKMQLSHGEHSDIMGIFYQVCALVLAGLIVYQLQKYCCSSYLRPVQYKLRRPEAKHLCLKQ